MKLTRCERRRCVTHEINIPKSPGVVSSLVNPKKLKFPQRIHGAWYNERSEMPKVEQTVLIKVSHRRTDDSKSMRSSGRKEILHDQIRNTALVKAEGRD
jgi:hypothetical protein